MPDDDTTKPPPVVRVRAVLFATLFARQVKATA